MRMAVQPGPVQSPRIVTVAAEPVADHRVHLSGGACLLDGFRDAMLSRGCTSAAALIVGGAFDHVRYLTGMEDGSGERVATYGPPTDVDGPVTLVSGNAILGAALDGTPLVHCHAVMVDAAGKLHGGHLPPGTSRLGQEGAVLVVTAHRGARFEVAFDPETNYAIFGPVRA